MLADSDHRAPEFKLSDISEEVWNVVSNVIIPKSKMDQQAKGVTRTLARCGKETCERACPFAMAMPALGPSRTPQRSWRATAVPGSG